MRPNTARSVTPAIYLSLAFASSALGQSPKRGRDLDTVRKLLELPAERIDLARAKLTIDRLIDRHIDIEKTMQQVDRMVEAVRSLLPAGANKLQTLAALRVFLHTPGPWNHHEPFAYGFDDPLGTEITHKLLPTYIATKRGNCVSMPLLFIILGQRLGLEITASTAPQHVLAKYRMPTGQWINVEATSGGGFARDSWIQRQHPMTQDALASGIYLQPLTKHETVVVMLSTLMEHYAHKGWHESNVSLAELALEYYPRSVSAMLHMGAAYGEQLQRDCSSKYRSLLEAPEGLRHRCARLVRHANQWWSTAEALGWRMPTPAQENAYRDRILEAAASR